MNRFFIFLCLSISAIAVSVADDLRFDLGPTDLLAGPDPDVLFILERDAKRLRKVRVDASDSKPVFLSLPMVPERMRYSPDRRSLAVVGGGAWGRLLMVDAETLSVTADIPVGHTPSDVAVGRSGSPVYVADRFDGEVVAIDPSSGRTLRRFPAGREPIALALTPDERMLVVAGHLPEDEALRFDISAKVRLIDTQSGETTAIRLLPGTINLRDIVLSADARHAFVTGVFGHFEHLPDSVGNGWMNENHLFMIDLKQRRFIGSQGLDEHAIGSANPWGLSLSEDGRFLAVATAGSCDVILLNLAKLIDVPANALTSRLPLKMRVPIALKGVRHVLYSKGRIYATSYFEDVLARIKPDFTEPIDYVSGILPKDDLDFPRRQPRELRPDVTTAIRMNVVKRSVAVADPEVKRDAPLHFVALPDFSIAPGIRFERSFARLGPEPVWSDVRYGEMLFHDATICEEHWQSCSTCHSEARSDALNWDLLNDGSGNPKNTKSLFLSHETPPSMATGVRETAELAVRKGFETILMIPAREEEARAVDAYLCSREAVPSPRLVFDRSKEPKRPSLSESAKRGKGLFDKVGCAGCHPEPLFTDLRKHDVGTQSSVDMEPRFDTPTLVEVWRTAPYLHDGRYKTIRELLVEGRHVDLDGRLGRLSDVEIDDLVEYVLSL